jgi:UDP-N-acetylmuramoylalanine--D-glutamate ligase
MDVSYSGRKVLVLGLARSGAAAIGLLLGAGAEVRGADEDPGVVLAAGLEGASVHRGPFDAAHLAWCDEVVVSPGIPANHDFVQEAEKRGIPVIGELELGFRFAGGEIIAITGTNGKSTTVSMIGEILKAEGRESVVAGNVGVPFCSVAGSLGPSGLYVLEVSSFQLETVSGFHPTVSGLLNLTPDHLDRYRTVQDYYEAKSRIIENSGEADTFFFNALDRRCVEVAKRFPGKLVPFASRPVGGALVYLDGDSLKRTRVGMEETFMERGELGVVGLHNVGNALAAVAAVDPFGVSADSCRSALSGFTGLPHRMEEVSRIEDVVYYNDSKATNVEATVMSLSGLDAPVVLIAGGHDKGGDFTKLLHVLDAVKAVVVIGEAAPLIEEALGSHVPVARAQTMQEAVDIAARTAEPGQFVILSPACASFDMFKNFEHRGEVFRACVAKLEKARSHER